MPVAVADSYTTTAGGSIIAGRPAAVPAWMLAATVGTYYPMPNSAGAGGSAVDQFCGMVLDDNMTLWIAAAGGHGWPDNRVVKYDMNKDTPTGWELVREQSPVVNDGPAYQPDGKPSARHTYFHSFYDPTTKKIALIGAYGINSQAWGANTIDTFDTVSAQWDAAGTNPYTEGTALSLAGASTVAPFRDPRTGDIYWWNGSQMCRWKPGTSRTNMGANLGLVRFPNVWDTSRSAIFGVCWGDSQGQGSGINTRQVIDPFGANTSRTISLTGNGVSRFTAATPQYPGMDYDSVRDKYVLFTGATSGAGTLQVYEITPDAGATWDMSIADYAGSVSTVSNAAMQDRAKYVRKGSVGGFVIMPKDSTGMYFYRTS